MPRLRITTAGSLLMLACGVAGTFWLSGLTAGDSGRHPAVAWRVPAVHAARPAPVRHVLAQARPGAHLPAATSPQPQAGAATPAAVPLVPLQTPPAAAPYARLRGHLDGALTLRVAVDGGGAVRQVRVLRSSGDTVLDAHALATVAHWRFAIPPSHPAGFSGELPLRFQSGTR